MWTADGLGVGKQPPSSPDQKDAIRSGNTRVSASRVHLNGDQKPSWLSVLHVFVNEQRHLLQMRMQMNEDTATVLWKLQNLVPWTRWALYSQPLPSSRDSCSWFGADRLSVHFAPYNPLANSLHMETNVQQCLVIQNHTPIKDEGRLQHVVIDGLVIVGLWNTAHGKNS